MAGFLDSFLAGSRAGAEDRRRKTLADYFQKASGGDADALGKVYAVDQDAGMQAQQFGARQAELATSQDEARRKRLGQNMRMLASAGKSGNHELAASLYARMRPDFEQDLPGLPLPPQWDPAMAEKTVQMADALDPQDATEGRVVGDALVDPRTGRVIYQGQQPRRIIGQQIADDGSPYNVYSDGVWERAQFGGGPQMAMPAPSTGGGGQVLDDALTQAVMQQESGGNPNAVSSKGAMGTMQTMPGTLRDPGYGVQPARDGSPAEMERVGKDYLRAMVGKYGTEGGLAAYNWGPGNWEAALQRSGGDAQRALASAPAETRNYVPSVLGRTQGGSGAPTFGSKNKAEESFQQLSPAEVQALGLPQGTVAQRSTKTGKVDIVNKPDVRNGQGELSAGEAAKVRTDFKQTKDALGMFKALDAALQSIPSDASLMTDGDKRGRLGTAYSNARSAIRILYNTGVLQPGELPMLEQALRDPTSASAILDPRTRPQLRAQLDELYRTVQRGIETQVTSYPQIFNQQKYAQTKAQLQSQRGSGHPTVTTQAQYDALPRGALYVEDGQTYRKP